MSKVVFDDHRPHDLRHVELEPIEVVRTASAIHMRFKVVRD